MKLIKREGNKYKLHSRTDLRNSRSRLKYMQYQDASSTERWRLWKTGACLLLIKLKNHSTLKHYEGIRSKSTVF